MPELRHGLLSHKAWLTSHLRPVKPEEQTHLYKPPVRFSQRPLFKHGFLAMHGFTFMIFNKI